MDPRESRDEEGVHLEQKGSSSVRGGTLLQTVVRNFTRAAALSGKDTPVAEMEWG